MQPARIKPHAKEHTNNPVQRPNFRGQGAKVMQLATVRSPDRRLVRPMPRPTVSHHQGRAPGLGTKGTPTDDHPRGPETQPGRTVEGRTQVAVLPRCVRAIKPIGCGCAGQVPRCQILHRHEHASSTSTSRHDTSNHAASCWPRGKSLHLHEHARRTGTHAT